MSTLTVFADVADDAIISNNSTYSTARAGSGLALVGSSATTLTVGQQASIGTNIWQAFESFDTSSIGAGASVSAATLTLTGLSAPTDTGDTIDALDYDWGTSVTTANWRDGTALAALTVRAHIANASWAVSANAFTDNSLASAINKTGSTRLVLASDEDRANTAPAGNAQVTYASADTAGTTSDPKLVVTYTLAGAVLAATPAAVSVTTADLTDPKPLVAAPAAVSVVTANLTDPKPLVAAPVGTSTTTANLTADMLLKATPAAVSVTTADLTDPKPLVAAPAAVSVVTANLTDPKPLAAAVASVSTTSANLTADLSLAAAPAAASAVTASLRLSPLLQAAITATSNVTALLVTPIPETGVQSQIYLPSGSMASSGEILQNALASWTDPWLDVGSGQLAISASDVKATTVNLAPDNIIACTINDVVRYAFFIESVKRVMASPNGPADETWTVGGRGMESYLARAITYPLAYPETDVRNIPLVLAPIDGGAATGLAASAAIGATNLKVSGVTGFTVGMLCRLGDTPETYEVVEVRTVGTAGSGGTGLGIRTNHAGAGLALAHASTETLATAVGSTVNSTSIGVTSFAVADVSSLRTGQQVTVGPAGSFQRRTLTVIDPAIATLTLDSAISAAAGDFVVGTEAPTGRRSFTAPPGQIVAILLGEATARGELPLLNVTFGQTLDTNSHAWGSDVSVDFSVGTTLLSAWQTLIGLGLYADARFVSGKVELHAWASDPGTDQTPFVVLRQGWHLRDIVTTDSEQGGWLSRVLVTGADGSIVEVIDPSETADNRRDGSLTFGNSSDPGTLTTAGEDALAAAQAIQAQITVPIHHSPTKGQYTPYVNYSRGDTVALDVPGIYAQAPYRVQQVTVEQDGSRNGGYLVELALNSRKFDIAQRIKIQLDALASTTKAIPSASLATASVQQDAIADGSVTAAKIQALDYFTMMGLDISRRFVLPTYAGSPPAWWPTNDGSTLIDTVNHKLWVCFGGVWKGVVLS